MKVYAKNETIAKHIKHPAGNLAFDSDGMAEWPDDQFTRRRLRDGDITLGPEKKEAASPKRITRGGQEESST